MDASFFLYFIGALIIFRIGNEKDLSNLFGKSDPSKGISHKKPELVLGFLIN
jgi:hypothetical protein